jgi:SSS family solute:Na+ symporter
MIPLACLALSVLVALGLGLRARAGREMGLGQWAVAERGFGAVFVFVLLAGEIYTTFTLLGASGYAYGQGAPSYYILVYGSIAYVIGYFMLPAIWSYARRENLVTQPDFFARKYDSRALGVLVSLVDVVALIPYLVLQLTGLGIIVTAASGGAIPTWASVLIGAAKVAAYVIVSGVRGSAWTAVVKDTLILGVVLFLGLYLPQHLFGGIGPMFAQIEHARPGFLTFPATGHSVWWFVSTVLLTALGFFMWPHSFAATYTATEARVFRRNAVLLPLYQLILLFVYFVGFAAVLTLPGLHGADTNLVLFRLVAQQLPPWALGVVGAAGVLTALVPGSLIAMTTATLLARNLYGVARASADDAAILRLAKVLVVMAVASWLAIAGSSTIVTLLLVGYSFVTQLFPPLIASLAAQNRVTAAGAASGVVVGVATAAWLTFADVSLAKLLPFMPTAVQDLNVGIVALALNVVVMLAVSAMTRRPAPVRAVLRPSP